MLKGTVPVGLDGFWISNEVFVMRQGVAGAVFQKDDEWAWVHLIGQSEEASLKVQKDQVEAFRDWVGMTAVNLV